jgi:RND family efflux transporter MFP subunit
MSRTKIILLAVVLIAIVAFVALRGGKKSQPAADAVKPALTVTTAVPETQVWALRVLASGSVLAWQEAIIGAEVGGVRLVEMHANVGDRVKKGEELARLSDETLSADMQQQQAAFDEASARYNEAAANEQRALKIKDAGVMSAQELQQFVSGAAIAKAQMNAAQARLDSARLKVRYTRIVAPDDGLISSRSATLGSVAQVGAELFRLIRQGKLEWRAELTDVQMQQVRIGQKVQVHAGASDTVQGVVSRISPAVDAATRNGYVYIGLLDNRSLRAGMFTEGEFDLGKTNALTVPQSAVVIRDGYAYVYQVAKDGRVAQIKVTTGRRDGERIELLRGLAADATVVASGAGFLSDGDLVRIEIARPKLKAASALSLELKSNI